MPLYEKDLHEYSGNHPVSDSSQYNATSKKELPESSSSKIIQIASFLRQKLTGRRAIRVRRDLYTLIEEWKVADR
jgi:hypothetical protein